jgi:alpha-beta hydrolase superfamily lysophospholipase
MAQASRTSTWVNDILARIAAASGVGYLATAYSISRWLTRASPAPIDLPASTPGLAWENADCTTADGFRLSGWVVTPPRPHATVALFHGMRRNRLQLRDRIETLAAAGYRCVAFDHRAHGQSTGKRASFGWFEAGDVLAVAEYIAGRWPDAPTMALGVSMGAAALCFAAGRTDVFEAFVLESLYHDLAGAFRHRVGAGYPAWFAHFARGAVWVTERRLGVKIDEVAPASFIARMAPRPVLLLAGSEDPHAPPEDVERLFETCNDPREFHVIAGAGHLNLDVRGGDHYRDIVLRFFARHRRGLRLAA